jgi:hypothetical protein
MAVFQVDSKTFRASRDGGIPSSSCAAFRGARRCQ